MSNWSIKNPPVYRPDAVASALGWTDPVTGEVLVAIGNLLTKQGPLASWPTFTLAVPANGTYHKATPDTLTSLSRHRLLSLSPVSRHLT